MTNIGGGNTTYSIRQQPQKEEKAEVNPLYDRKKSDAIWNRIRYRLIKYSNIVPYNKTEILKLIGSIGLQFNLFTDVSNYNTTQLDITLLDDNTIKFRHLSLLESKLLNTVIAIVNRQLI